MTFTMSNDEYDEKIAPILDPIVTWPFLSAQCKVELGRLIIADFRLVDEGVRTLGDDV